MLTFKNYRFALQIVLTTILESFLTFKSLNIDVPDVSNSINNDVTELKKLFQVDDNTLHVFNEKG